MRPAATEYESTLSPEQLVERLQGEPGVMLLRSALFDLPEARYSFVTARPFLTFRSFGSRCEVRAGNALQEHFGNPWHLLERLLARYELLDEPDLPFPLGGCFGFWSYDLKNFVEPRLPRRAANDLELPETCVGFYDSLVVFDHRLGKTWIVATGLAADGSRTENRAQAQRDFWHRSFEAPSPPPGEGLTGPVAVPPAITSNLTREEFIARVARVLVYIRSGDIYQVNLSHRLSVPYTVSPNTPPLHHSIAPAPPSAWLLFDRLSAASPAPFSAYFDAGDFQIVSSSPERFMRLSGSHIQTRPIKGTRPRSSDPTRDAQLTYELQTSAKEMAELVMITDLLRNDLGRVCEFGTVHVPELIRLERYPQVQHLVSTVEGRLRNDTTHLGALAGCFPGGSITGAPKIRAMEIIDELEPIARGPYTGALGYLGFNRESQLSIIIRTAIYCAGQAHFHVGAGIVADSDPAAEYEETLAKARGFFQALHLPAPTQIRVNS
jgi:para-aminobenzoate synthetase component 1